jgi:hypothetical protein
MTQQSAEHHTKAAEHHEHAARHHKEAVKHHASDSHEKVAHHATSRTVTIRMPLTTRKKRPSITPQSIVPSKNS